MIRAEPRSGSASAPLRGCCRTPCGCGALQCRPRLPWSPWSFFALSTECFGQNFVPGIHRAGTRRDAKSRVSSFPENRSFERPVKPHPPIRSMRCATAHHFPKAVVRGRDIGRVLETVNWRAGKFPARVTQGPRNFSRLRRSAIADLGETACRSSTFRDTIVF